MDNNQKIITFEFKKGEKDPNDIIVEILENNGLKEDLDDYANKVDKEETPWFDMLYKLVMDFASNNITEQEFISLARQQMNISNETAENILKEAKQRLIPITRILTEDDLNLEESSEEEISIKSRLIKPIKQPIDVAKVLRQTQNKNISPPQPLPRQTQQNEKPKLKQNEPLRQKRANDTYREPIE